jgi:hypothetical protein
MAHVEWDKILSRKVSPDDFLFKAKRVTKATKTTLAMKLRTSNAKSKVVLIDCLIFSEYTSALFIEFDSYLFTTLETDSYSLQLHLWLTWTLSHDLYLFELLTWSYLDSNSTWFPPQLGFQLNWIPHPWTLLGLFLVYPGLDSSLLELKVLILPFTWTPFQFGLVSSIFFLSSPKQLTRVTFTLSAYPILPDRLTRILPEQLT